MYCRECGKELTPFANFCKFCGSRVDQYNIPQKRKEIRKSKQKFDSIKWCYEFHLKYEYYNIPIERDDDSEIDFASLPIDQEVSFTKRGSDKDGYCRVQYLDYDTMNYIVVGHITNKSLNNMIPKYDADFSITRIDAFIDQVDEINGTATVAIGFYKKLTKDEYDQCRYIETKLIRTTKKEEYVTPRQTIIGQASINSPVEFEYDYSSETYIVSNFAFEEMGEINTSVSSTLREAELAGDTFHGLVYSIDENTSGKLDCTIRIIFDSRFPPFGGYVDPKMVRSDESSRIDKKIERDNHHSESSSLTNELAELLAQEQAIKARISDIEEEIQRLE